MYISNHSEQPTIHRTEATIHGNQLHIQLFFGQAFLEFSICITVLLIKVLHKILMSKMLEKFSWVVILFKRFQNMSDCSTRNIKISIETSFFSFFLSFILSLGLFPPSLIFPFLLSVCLSVCLPNWLSVFLTLFFSFFLSFSLPFLSFFLSFFLYIFTRKSP